MNMAFWRSILHAAIYTIFAMALIVLFTLGPRIEALINPVITAFEIKHSWQEDGAYYIDGALIKARGECEPTSVVMYADGGITDENAKIVRIEFPLSEDDEGFTEDLLVRPKGSQFWGPWRINPPIEPIGPIFSIVTTHKCHALWSITHVVYNGLTSDIFPGLILDEARIQ